MLRGRIEDGFSTEEGIKIVKVAAAGPGGENREKGIENGGKVLDGRAINRQRLEDRLKPKNVPTSRRA